MDNNNKILIVVAVVILVGGLLTGVLVIPENFPKSSSCQNVPYEGQEEYLKTEYYSETVPYTEQVCENKELVYSLTDFKNVGNCIQYQERCIDYLLGICTEKEKFCVKKEVSSSLNIKNLDNERGKWIVQFSYSLDGVDQDQQTLSLPLFPEEKRLTGVLWTIQGEENNKKDDRYGYKIVSEPTKQVCRDVTKYKEVERSREVTAYRPVTKYREECN